LAGGSLNSEGVGDGLQGRLLKLRLRPPLIRTDARLGPARLSVEVFAHLGPGRYLFNGSGGSGFQVQVAPCRIGEGFRDILDHVADERDGTVGLVADGRTADQVVGDHEPIIGADQTEQSPHRALRIVDRVVQDLAVAGIRRDDA